MKNYKNFWIVIALFFTIAAQATVRIQAGVWVIDPPKAFLYTLNHNPELVVDHVGKAGYEVYGPNGLEAFLTKNHIHFSVLQKPQLKDLREYPTPEETVRAMQDLQKKYPTLITLEEIGLSVKGRSLMVAKITAPAQNGARFDLRPEFKYVANMHGDEIVGREMMVQLIEDLASNYGRDQRITKILDFAQVYIMPSMNPDGAAAVTRANANGVDLNRSFPDFTTEDNQNSSTNREPEIQAMMKFQAAHHFKLSANFHGGAEVVNYPWDTTADAFPLLNLVKALSLDYSKRVSYLWNSTQFQQGVTNGYAWYEVNGGMQDWSYHWYNDLQVTIELTKTKWPALNTIQKSYAANRDALLAYIEDLAQVK